MDKKAQPWDRQRDSDGKLEPNRWYGRFTDYRWLGSDRALLAAYRNWRVRKGAEGRNINSVARSWERAFRKWHWAERAEAWDEHKRAEDEVKWDNRRHEIREREWSQAGTLLDRARQMLKFPLAQVERVERTDADGNPLAVTVVKPARWSQRDIARFMQVSSELARLAAEMEQRLPPLDLTGGLTIVIERDGGKAD